MKQAKSHLSVKPKQRLTQLSVYNLTHIYIPQEGLGEGVGGWGAREGLSYRRAVAYITHA